MQGTASRVRRYLLVEAPGPWGVEALRDSRLPDGLKRELRRRSRSTGVRVLLIRRFGGPRTVRHPQVYVVDTGTPPASVGGQLTDIRDVLDPSLWSTTPDTRANLDRHGEPLFLVCTHGRHDPCCAERGRPVASALSAAYPEHTWECSHMGGDRFAGNLLCLPDGIAYGRVAPEDAPTIAREYLDGRLDLAHLRGRGRYPFAVQAAEWHLLTKLGLTGKNDLVLAEH
ncbi:MAG TPA: sucrase ferredoxin, partial [Jiangellaceae bacterium]